MTKRVLVTGSSRGIGRAIALALAEVGFAVCVHGRKSSEQLDSLEHELVSRDAFAGRLEFDVSEREAARECLSADIEAHGAFFGVVCNAGISRDGPFPGFEDEDWDQVMGVNLDSFYNVLHPIVLPMIRLRCGGRIVTMSSLSGITGMRGQVNYSAAKAGIIGASKALAKELAKRRISVNCVAPGIIETEFADEHTTQGLIEAVPMKRAGRAEEVAALVAYLFSEPAEYLTGQVISINGGLV